MNKLLRILLMIVVTIGGTAHATQDAASQSPFQVRLKAMELKATTLAFHGRKAEAFDAWRDVQLYIHQNEGVDSLSQVGALGAMINLHLRDNEVYEAERKKRMVLRLYALQYDKNDIRYVPVLRKVAGWEAAAGAWSDAVFTYEDAIRIVEKHLKKSPSADLKMELASLNEAADNAATRMFAADMSQSPIRW